MFSSTGYKDISEIERKVDQILQEKKDKLNEIGSKGFNTKRFSLKTKTGESIYFLKEKRKGKKDDVDTAVGYALASQYLGMDFFYLEAGSGSPTTVSNEMITAVKKNIDIPLIVGGGIEMPRLLAKR